MNELNNKCIINIKKVNKYNMSYDIKFKQRAVEYQTEGHTYKETCKVFKISETTLTRWINKRKGN